MTGSWLSVAAAFGLVALNGFFVATEFALVKVRPTRLDELAGERAPPSDCSPVVTRPSRGPATKHAS